MERRRFRQKRGKTTTIHGKTASHARTTSLQSTCHLPAFDACFADSTFVAFQIGTDGRLLALNGSGRALLGPAMAPGVAVADLYAPWAAQVLLDEALPLSRTAGCWRGELDMLGADGRVHAMSQVIEWRDGCHLCLSFEAGAYDEFESSLRFKRLFDHHPQPMWVYDLDSLRFLVVNQAAVRHYGYTEAEFLAMTIKDIRPQQDVERLLANVAAAPRQGVDRAGCWTHCKKDGSRIRVDISSHSVSIAGRPARFVLCHDVTAQLEMEAALHASRALKQLIINQMPLQIFWKDLQSRYLGCNAVFARAAGLESTGDVAGKCDDEFPWARNAARIRADERDIIASGQPQLNREDHMRDADGNTHWYLINKLPLHDQQGQIFGVLGTIEDISERKRYQQQLEHQASHDALTDLPNRNLLADRLEQAIAYAQRHAQAVWIVFIDLDNFKLVNDSQGHQHGDLLLRTVAERLRACVRDSDTVARPGGDEFTLLLLEAPAAPTAASVLQRVLEAVAAPVTLGARQHTITCSIGVSVCPDDGADVQQLLRQADIAMYRAKEAGRNQIQFYEAAMQARVAERSLIEEELRQALGRGQLSLHYQPKASLQSGAMQGMEALLRWQHPTLGAVSPARFIGVAEETGLIVPIGRWAIRTACAQNQAWQQAGLAPQRIAVNLSSRQFSHPALVDDVIAALADSGLKAQYLELELTESLMMHNVDACVAVLQRLKKLGVSLAIDDFGTGYSSLAYLRLLPLDYLKIDQSFVRDMLDDPNVAAIVRSTISLAHSLNFKVVAEGVETAAQLAYLRRYQCDEMQGYFFSRPLAAPAMAALLQQEHALPAAQPAGGARQTLLLLDDEPNVLAALARLLKRDGYTILRANTAAEAFELLAMHEVHVVVSDQRMPVMNGTEFLSRVKQLYPGTIRIILSGYTEVESILSAINRGEIYRFYTKPWHDQDLRDNIREAFQYHQLIHGQLSEG